MKKTGTVLIAASASSLIPTASFATIYSGSSLDTTISDAVTYLNLNVVTGLYETTTVSSNTNDFQFRLYGEMGGGATEKPYVTAGNSWQVQYSGGYVERLDLNETLGGSFTTSAYLKDHTSGEWYNDAAGTIGYISILNSSTGVSGWIGIDYDDVANTITLDSYAIGTAGEITLAGVPEPSQTAAIGALLAGSAVLYSRRRRKTA